MKIALAQMRMQKNSDYNLQVALQATEQAASNKADLIFFPELQFSPFFPQYEGLDMKKYALTIDHSFIKELADKSKELEIIISPNFYLKEENSYYDASLMISAGGEIQGVSKMVHITQGQYFYEQDYYNPSNDGFKVYKTPFGKIGIVICFDRHLPESIRTCVAMGADLILIPTANTEGEPLELFEWELRVQAIQSSVFIAMCNRVGQEDNMNFIGQSIVVNPNGNIVTKADRQEQIMYADIDLSQSNDIRKKNPYFRLRRPEFYK
ncbi:carbon-nitrogen hydrolase family protein [Acetobacterium carbinolicum]|uniref:carbon-nitrogen hydrolase family protein n=1 Tax=Acetobacterium carbinolicum TaxID=52690 RepID=UPI0039C942EB